MANEAAANARKKDAHVSMDDLENVRPPSPKAPGNLSTAFDVGACSRVCQCRCTRWPHESKRNSTSLGPAASALLGSAGCAGSGPGADSQR
eukprot:248156-Pyramimonas_sp.AAC.1